MRAGRLRHRVELQSNTATHNEIGEASPGWNTDATVWAGIKPAGGQERYRNNKESAEVTHEIRLRYYAGLNPSMRIKYGSRIFDIQRVLNVDERDADMIVLAIEQV